MTDDETLGRIYVEDMELLDVPDNVLPYFDFEAYGRDIKAMIGRSAKVAENATLRK